MALDAQAVAKIARLARIEVTDAQKAKLAHDLSGILQWVEQLNEVNTDKVPQMTSVAAMALPWREDKVTDGDRQDAVITNAPASDYDCFVVPKVME